MCSKYTKCIDPPASRCHVTLRGYLKPRLKSVMLWDVTVSCYTIGSRDVRPRYPIIVLLESIALRNITSRNHVTSDEVKRQPDLTQACDV